MIGATLVASQPAVAEGGTRVVGDAVYTVEPVAGVLHTELELEITNQTSSTRSGNTITNYYYDSYSVGIHSQAENVTVLQDGVAGEFEIVSEGQLTFIAVTFAGRLNYNRKTILNVSYDVRGLPRTTSNHRINAALTSTYLFAWGDPGLSSVTIGLPQGQIPEFSGSNALKKDPASPGTWFESEIENPVEWLALVDARNNGALSVVPVTVRGSSVVVRAWPGDAEWFATVRDVVTAGQPALLDLLGLDWPVEETLIVQESIDPTLSGYGGWFFTEDALIEIGENLDANLILHELSHAWFNGRLYSDRWIGEGFAEYYGRKAAEVIGEGGGIASTPLDYHPARFDLGVWPGVGESDQEQEIWGYDTSFYIIQTIAEELGEEGMQAVLESAFEHKNAYDQSLAEPEFVESWRLFLDVLEEVGGSTKAQDLFSDWVLPPSQDEPLAERAAARVVYHELLEHAASWTVPTEVAQAMAAWDFEEASVQMKHAEETLGLNDSAAKKAVLLNLELPDNLEEAFESAGMSYEQAIETGLAQMESLSLFEEAVASSELELSVVEQLGLWNQDISLEVGQARDNLESGEFDEANLESLEVVDLINGARTEGEALAKLLGLAVTALLLTVVGITLVVRRRKVAQAATQAEAPE